MANKIIITPVPINLINFMWDQCIPHFEKVIDRAHGELSLSTIKAKLLRGDGMLIVCIDEDEVIAINMLETTIFDTGLKVLAISCTGGTRLDEWMEDFLEITHTIARNLECDQLRGFAARKGWMRKLERLGWTETFTTIKCDVHTENKVCLDH